MQQPDDHGGGARRMFDHDEVEGVLNDSFYTPSPESERRAKASEEKPKPTHYKVICISMYTDTLDQLDSMVRELKRRGYTKANRSALIRHALSGVDLDEVPRGL